ncbi:DEAD-box ATP-dependent RNA helicase 10 [Acorus gramineus]|uniref:DEAD-box ATP-dependent RNA helicase 10 n=1 Tax=Acorus gramineus TaxID=55184 RepID=A0AAV8ZZG2_ACOGR|nr:DEAD-box ATP-dependent RNA helicase 10 [Acorus gramineus]
MSPSFALNASSNEGFYGVSTADNAVYTSHNVATEDEPRQDLMREQKNYSQQEVCDDILDSLSGQHNGWCKFKFLMGKREAAIEEEVKTFKSLSVCDELVEACEKLGWKTKPSLTHLKVLQNSHFLGYDISICDFSKKDLIGLSQMGSISPD